MSKITENIKSLAEVMNNLQKLEDPEFILEQGLSEEDIINIESELKSQIINFELDGKEYIEYKLKQIQEDKIILNGLDIEIKRLQDLKKSKENSINKIENWIDYIMKTFSIKEMETEFNKLSYRKSESVSIIDETIIPQDFKSESITIKIDKTSIKKVIKEGNLVPGAILEEKQNLQIK